VQDLQAKQAERIVRSEVTWLESPLGCC